MFKDRDYTNAPPSSPGPKGQEAEKSATSTPQVPSISLPKGGGAIRGLGEKFAANPVTGTGSMTVPLAVSPSRSGFGPQLSLFYDSGAGNGSFGFGWNLSLPAISRKTDKGLPQYRDADESDVFILSGAEDLVPVPWPDGRLGDDTSVPAYTIHRYRPRIEGLFARIERWTRTSDGDVHWRSFTKDNLLTLYGRNDNTRVTDPQDSKRVFSWLICETRDDKGNAVVYQYKKEDSLNVDLSQAHERNRGDNHSRGRAANRYIKYVRYGNRVPLLDAAGRRPLLVTDDALQNAGWMFEIVFDYGEGHYRDLPLDSTSPPAEQHRFATASLSPLNSWPTRQDSFSRYRAGFEVRNYRLCRRVLMFHHFPQELGTADCLVRATEFTYNESPVASFISAVTQSGYVRRTDGNYLKQSMPPLEFEYSKAVIHEDIKELDADSLRNLPVGLNSPPYQWVDLDGEGLSGILTEQANAWFYKPNLGEGRFGPLEVVAAKPSFASLSSGGQQLLDLSGNGQLDLVTLAGSTPGFFERTLDEDWTDFKSFASLPNISWDEPNLRFVDLNGDGHADVLIAEDQVFTWHPSLADDGFGPAQRVQQQLNEEQGPRLVFADGTQSVYLADMCGDGLTDLVRIRNGEVSYWPNCGYGHFGARITMDNSPWFDNPDQFSQSRIRMADVDGSGNNDIIYLDPNGVRIYFNQSGNHWSEPRPLRPFPDVDNLSSVMTADLMGNGTACLVWSSPLPGAARRPIRYIDLMGGQKPHLMIKASNNLGAETRLYYAASTSFYLADKAAGTPWITRLPFPVHVVERVETYDFISRNRFVTRYAYHHGYFDGVEREFRGFAMVEQWDTEQLATLNASDAFPIGDNVAGPSHVPPVHTKTWFHTGIYLGRDHVSDYFAGQLDEHKRGEYYREASWEHNDGEAKKRLLNDTVLPSGLALDEEREACRALKGTMLRREVYALDGTDRAVHPYTVSEQNFTVRLLQRGGNNRHAVFFTHAREGLNYHYERAPSDPRISHTLTLEVDEFGNVLKEVAVAYGRRQADVTLPMPTDRDKQTRPLITYTENKFSNPLVEVGPQTYRTPLPCETRTYELTGYSLTAPATRFQISDFVKPDPNHSDRLVHIFESEIKYEDETSSGKQRRLIEQVRTLYRKNDLTALLPLGTVDSLALPGESFKLAFTTGLLIRVFRRDGQPLVPNPANVFGGQGPDRGGYLLSQDASASGFFPATDPADQWWIPAGQVFYSPDASDDAAAELAHARQHFFLPQRHRDVFGQSTTIRYDTHNLLMVETRDALGNRVSVGERKANGDLDESKPGNDYRVLQPRLITDPNRNRAEVMFDGLGLVVGTAVKGKDDTQGDTLAGFEPHLTEAQVDGFYDVADPHAPAPNLLLSSTARIVYDLHRFRRTKQAHPGVPTEWLPTYAATLARESHVSDPPPAHGLRIQISFSYSDGFGREIQKKIQAEPGPLIESGPVVSPRWVGSGWTIFNNKGKPVRQYEPFFSQLDEKRHRFEFGMQVGVSPILFYDPVERVVATLHPNHSYEKVVFDPWQQTTYDVNDTVKSDPGTDNDVKGFFLNPDSTQRLPVSDYLPTWHALRTDPAHAVAANLRWPDPLTRDAEKKAAEKAEVHENTPTIAYFDTLGRPFLTTAHNKFKRERPDGTIETIDEKYATRTDLDIEGNQRTVRDAIVQNGDQLGRVVMLYDYDMLGTRIHQASMEAGQRWMLSDAAGKPIRAWTSRGHIFRTEYDPLRRPLRSFVTGADPLHPDKEYLTERMVYGEQHPQDELLNLRGKLFLHLDQAGVARNEAHDFKGNVLRASRRLAREYKQALDWKSVDAVLPATSATKLNLAAMEAVLSPLAESDTFTSHTSYDALNRQIQLIEPHSDQPGAKRNVIQPVYNDANLLERVHVWLDHPTEPAGLIDETSVTPANVGVNNIDYDAKGQRRRIDYKNGATTHYAYDPDTLRLVHLYTRRGAAFDRDCDNPGPPPATIAAPDVPPEGKPCGLQNLHYTYDPVGNITHIRDDAQQTIYFNGQVVPPHCDYRYDAIYRLIAVEGREHIGQVAQPETTWSDEFRVRLPHPNESLAMRNYTEAYEYDAVGNFKNISHRAVDGNWTRSYTYSEASLIEPAKKSNSVSTTAVGDGAAEIYPYDAHGNMTRLNHLPLMRWDYSDQLQATGQQVVTNAGIPETTWYVYDAAGQRARKVTDRALSAAAVAAGQTPTRLKERIYLAGFEIYREYESDVADVKLARETLQVMDDKQRIALVETRIQGNDAAPPQLIRYQLGNHLGSASLELDHQARIISYEEFYPYGSTSYQAVRSATETSKRYRYTGKERDEESGFYYHGARYYAPWLARWTSVDPEVIDNYEKSDRESYAYVKNRPIVAIDPNGRFLWFLAAAIVIAVVATPQISNAPRPTDTPTTRSSAELALNMAENAVTIYAAPRALAGGIAAVAEQGLTRGGGTIARNLVVGQVRAQVVQQTANVVDPTGTLGRVANLSIGARGTQRPTAPTRGTGGSAIRASVAQPAVPRPPPRVSPAPTVPIPRPQARVTATQGGGRTGVSNPVQQTAGATNFSTSGSSPSGSGSGGGTVGTGRTFYHYTDVDPATMRGGLYSQSSFTTVGNLTPAQASTQLGIPTPRWVLTFADDGRFRPLGTGTVQPNPARGFVGGAPDYYHPGRPVPTGSSRMTP